MGQQPLKHVTARKGTKKNSYDDIFEEVEDEGDGQMGLYAEFQTEVYVPPPVEDGRVPKNAFGNIDVYVPTMVPRGGAHVPRTLNSVTLF